MSILSRAKSIHGIAPEADYTDLLLTPRDHWPNAFNCDAPAYYGVVDGAADGAYAGAPHHVLWDGTEVRYIDAANHTAVMDAWWMLMTTEQRTRMGETHNEAVARGLLVSARAVAARKRMAHERAAIAALIA